MSLSEIVARARGGDSGAVTELYENFKTDVYFLCRSLVAGDDNVTSELVQSSFLHAFHKLEYLKNPENFRPWLLATASRRCRSYLSERDPVAFLAAESAREEGEYDVPDIGEGDDIADSDEARAVVMEAVMALPALCRTALLLYYFCRMNVSQTAKNLGVTPGVTAAYLAEADEAVRLAASKKEGEITPLAPYRSGALYTVFDREAEVTVVPSALSEIIIGAGVTLISAAAAASNTENIPHEPEQPQYAPEIIDIEKEDYDEDLRDAEKILRRKKKIAKSPSVTISLSDKTNKSGKPSAPPKQSGNVKNTHPADNRAKTAPDTSVPARAVKAPTVRPAMEKNNKVKNDEPRRAGSARAAIIALALLAVAVVAVVGVMHFNNYINVKPAGNDAESTYDVTTPQVTTTDDVTTPEVTTVQDVTTPELTTAPDETTDIPAEEYQDASSFTYDYNDDGNVVIIKYIGSDTVVNIPREIDDREVAEIGGRAFQGSTVTYVSIPSTVTLINHSAFEYCTSLSEVIIPDSVTEIQEYAFKDCSVLDKISIPKSVVTVGPSILNGSKWLEAQTDEFVTVGDGCLIRYNGKGGDVIVPDGVKMIANVFYYNAKIKSVTLPEGVRELGRYAFAVCGAMSTVSLPSTLTEFDDYAFYQNYAVTAIYAPAESAAAKWIAGGGYASALVTK